MSVSDIESDVQDIYKVKQTLDLLYLYQSAHSKDKFIIFDLSKIKNY